MSRHTNCFLGQTSMNSKKMKVMSGSFPTGGNNCHERISETWSLVSLYVGLSSWEVRCLFCCCLISLLPKRNPENREPSHQLSFKINLQLKIFEARIPRQELAQADNMLESLFHNKQSTNAMTTHKSYIIYTQSIKNQLPVLLISECPTVPHPVLVISSMSRQLVFSGEAGCPTFTPNNFKPDMCRVCQNKIQAHSGASDPQV